MTTVQPALFAAIGPAERCQQHGPHPHDGGHCLGCLDCRGCFRFCDESPTCTKQAGHHDEHGMGR